MRTKNPAIFDNLILLCLFVAFITVSLARHENALSSVIASDVEGYYMYLPAVFVYGGIHHIPERTFQGRITNEKGEIYTKFTCGAAYCYLPFFLIAHAYAHIFHLDASGFSDPYQYAIIVAGVFWSVLGLFLLKTLLLRYFSRTTTWITVLCVALGTNFYSYATLAVGMSHVYSFALFAATLLMADTYYKNPSKANVIPLAVLLGWVILTRPTSVTIVIFLFLFRVVSFADLKERVRFFLYHFTHLFIGLLFFIGIIFPQLLYWKQMSGKWISYSYGNERFIYWAHPKIAAVLFDVQNGWLLWSPIMLFLFWSLVMKRKDPRTNFWGTTIVFVIITYLFASWWAWWFGGAFGHRCYIDYLPIFAFPLAVTMENIIGAKSNYIKIPLFVVITLLCCYSVAMATMYFMRQQIWDGPAWQWNYDKWWGLVRRTFND